MRALFTVVVAVVVSGCNCGRPEISSDAGVDAGTFDAGLAIDCNGKGTPVTGTSACRCDTGFTGDRCERCDEFYVDYPRCVYCRPNETCNGNGSCNEQGGCDCSPGFAADAGCGACAPGFTGYPNCM